MQPKLNNEESNERYKRTLRFGIIALAVMVLNSVLDLERGLHVSFILVLIMIVAVGAILFAIYKGYTRGTVTAIVFIINPLLVLTTFAEGLNAGGYLFILPLLFALAFLMSNARMYLFEIAVYLVLTVASFCICILFCGNDSSWQHLSPKLSSSMFTYNSICVICLCAIFAYTGIYFEKQYKYALVAAKNTAEVHEEKIKEQNKYLQEIAYMNAHILRSPVTNILALASLIDVEKITDADNKEMIKHLQTSAQQLDGAIKEIVSKATNKE